MEVVSEIEKLIGNTTSTLDQTQMNFDVIIGVVNISRQIITDTNLDSEDVVEVMYIAPFAKEIKGMLCSAFIIYEWNSLCIKIFYLYGQIVHDVVDIVDTVIDWPEQEVEQSGSLYELQCV